MTTKAQRVLVPFSCAATVGFVALGVINGAHTIVYIELLICFRALIQELYFSCWNIDLIISYR